MNNWICLPVVRIYDAICTALKDGVLFVATPIYSLFCVNQFLFLRIVTSVLFFNMYGADLGTASCSASFATWCKQFPTRTGANLCHEYVDSSQHGQAPTNSRDNCGVGEAHIWRADGNVSRDNQAAFFVVAIIIIEVPEICNIVQFVSHCHNCYPDECTLNREQMKLFIRMALTNEGLANIQHFDWMEMFSIFGPFVEINFYLKMAEWI